MHKSMCRKIYFKEVDSTQIIIAAFLLLNTYYEVYYFQGNVYEILNSFFFIYQIFPWF